MQAHANMWFAMPGFLCGWRSASGQVLSLVFSATVHVQYQKLCARPIETSVVFHLLIRAFAGAIGTLFIKSGVFGMGASSCADIRDAQSDVRQSQNKSL
jgi:hypothetical protein